jgi:hypothetical protein
VSGWWAGVGVVAGNLTVTMNIHPLVDICRDSRYNGGGVVLVVTRFACLR